MRIFFVASIHGKKKFQENYSGILDYFREAGHTVEAGHVLRVSAKELESWDDAKDVEFHKKVLKGIRRADLVVAELSYTSTSVGYLVSVAVESGKPTIAFFSGEEIPHLLTTLEQDEKFQLVHYDRVEDIRKEIPILVDYATGQMDTRFNFFISRRISNYLDWVSKTKRIPRAVYLRNLINREMRKHKEFSHS